MIMSYYKDVQYVEELKNFTLYRKGWDDVL